MVLLAPYQAHLFAQGEPGVDPESPIVRHHLDDASWIDVGRGWLRGADELLVDLTRRLEWSIARRPMYGRIVDEPRLTAACEPAGAHTPSSIPTMAEALDVLYDEAFDSVWVNFYRDGRDSVAWHSDRVGRTQVNPVVAIVSLGGPRRFRLRRVGGGSSRSVTLASGDLLVMGGACQRGWEHTVPKVALAPPRMSVTFRRREGLLDPSDDWWRDVDSPATTITR